MDWTTVRTAGTDVASTLENTAATFGQSLRWAVGQPALVGSFLAVLFAGLTGTMYGVAFGLLAVVLTLVVSGVAYRYTAQQVEAEAGDPDEGFLGATATVVRRLLSLVVVLALYVTFVSVGLAIFLLPGVYISLRLTLAFPACIVDGYRAFDSVSMGWAVAGGNVVNVLGIVGLWLLGGGVLYTDFVVAGPSLLTPAFVVALSPVLAVVSAAATRSLGRLYVENRKSTVRGIPPA